ncbi:MAG: hypothetical protein WCF84_04350 [Anaerolineae bacterium]
MPLVIEYIGSAPRGLPLISVVHYYMQNGDAMCDPEMTFKVDPEGKQDWGPVTYQQDTLGIYQEAVWRESNGRVMIHPALVKDLKAFARSWDRNLKEQGFLKVASQARQ